MSGSQDPELSAALGWPGGISDPVLDRKTLLQMVAALMQDKLWEDHRVRHLWDQAQEQAEPTLTVERLRDALVASRIIPPAAVEDPDEYDDGVTLHRIEALHRRIA